MFKLVYIVSFHGDYLPCSVASRSGLLIDGMAASEPLSIQRKVNFTYTN